MSLTNVCRPPHFTPDHVHSNRARDASLTVICLVVTFSLIDGAILSELPMGTLPAPQRFPIRSRIFRAYAVPGNLTNELSQGPNTLIKKVIALVASWEDVGEALPADVGLSHTLAEQTASEASESASLFGGSGSSSTKNGCAWCCGPMKRHTPASLWNHRLPNSPPRRFSPRLFALELGGRIAALPAKCYVRAI